MSGRRLRKVKKHDEEITYWLSFSDLMSSLLIIFLLVSVYMLLDYKKAAAQAVAVSNELQDARSELEKFTSINDDIIKKIKEEFGDSLYIDDTGTLTLQSDLLFDSGKSELKAVGKEFIRKNMPRYFGILLKDPEIRSNIAKIIIEGYTDDLGDYHYGLDLSHDRALSVYTFIYNDPEFAGYREDLKNYIILTGRSETGFLKQMQDESVEDWRARNRRVEIKFELKYQEIFEYLKKSLDKEKI
ncbi:OmpA family protein [Desulfosporosinus sp. BICA1-9]|uniref:OmpA family protein n=1 Tax=Desulfosporosinus sp. BICA1-9 TaxID=1531958 RepID=UPI00054C1205|nr:OmpA family protein [Desulfosporosinus sp. BICA1-9]KJS49375.1 MAG: hypothetical protein VR66_08840 [Peptococcaceae bacterium BRH_c23]KJS80657.1 MAG: hypothetical protein JL57_27830 [Desulfosporosinus sp. BICA1-9]HBW34736.1 chemotaxis protein [Desulfosporosinus sp.]